MGAAVAFEADDRLDTLLDWLEQGEEVLITRHGRPVARLVRETMGADQAKAEAALARIRNRAASIDLGTFDWADFKRDRDAGRP